MFLWNCYEFILENKNTLETKSKSINQCVLFPVQNNFLNGMINDQNEIKRQHICANLVFFDLDLQF